MAALQRLTHRVGFQGLRVYWFVLRPHTRGVKLVVWSGSRILFVRHTYGDRTVWEMPGGGRKRNETPEAAARREAREELGLDIASWRVVGEIVSREHATAHLSCLSATHDGTALSLSRGELSEARWCSPLHPPSPLGRHATEVLALPDFPKTAS